jgi:hypothetical protein
MHMWSADPRFTDEHGNKLGWHLVFDSNPRSANYNPAYFNRCARALRAAGKAAPPDIRVRSRRLRDREF